MYDLIMANFAMHISLDEKEKDYVKSTLQHKVVKKNAVLLNPGEICRSFSFVNKGCLRVYYTDSDGSDHNISFCPENWWAVDVSSFFNKSPAFYSIAAIEESEVFYLSFAAIESLFLTVPKFERFFRILAQNGFNLYQHRIISNLSKTADERYLQFKQQYPKLAQRIAQKHIASYLGITPVFLSMLRSR